MSLHDTTNCIKILNYINGFNIIYYAYNSKIKVCP